MYVLFCNDDWIINNIYKFFVFGWISLFFVKCIIIYYFIEILIFIILILIEILKMWSKNKMFELIIGGGCFVYGEELVLLLVGIKWSGMVV